MAKKSTSSEKVTRITASSSKGKNKSTQAAEKANTKLSGKKSLSTTADGQSKTKKKGLAAIPSAIFGYFKGAWVELKQVHWPTRKTTWALTIAVLLFTAFFTALVLLLDAGFKYLFEQTLG